MFSFFYVSALLATLAVFIGWVLNVVQLVHAAAAPITGIFVLKCIGIVVVPFGGILGWVGLA